MSTKIIRSLKNSKVNSFVLRHFSDVELGQKDYVMRSFADDEEFSVQDAVSAANTEEPATVEDKYDEITDRDYLPPSKLAKAERGLVGEKVEMLKARPESMGFVVSSLFSDEDGDATSAEQPNEESDKASLIGSKEFQEKIGTLEAKVAELEAEKIALEKSSAEKDALIKGKSDELDALNATIPDKLGEAKEAGRSEGYNKGKEECEKHYEADKKDYLDKLEAFSKEASKKLEEVAVTVKSVDEQICDTVIGFVKSIVGAERKINDQFVVNLIKSNLERLNELKNVSFVVNPADVDIVKNHLPDYIVSSDISIEKGGVKVRSKVGEVSLDAKIMIADLEKQINEELGATENLKA